MNIKILRKFLWGTVLISLGITWLPYFGIFDSSSFFMGLPQPLAVIIGSNIILTLCVFSLYPLYFKPLIKKLEEKPLVSEVKK